MKDARPIPRLGLNRAELALSIGVSTTSIDTMVAEGVLPPPRIWHNRKIWVVSEVESAMLAWPTKDELIEEARSWDEPFKWSSDGRTTNPSKGAGGYPIVNNPKDPVKIWYDKLGFDPRTMGRADMERLMAKAEEEWLASIPNLKMLKSEKISLLQLKKFGVGVAAPQREIKGCGPGTEERLKARGLIEVKMKDGYPDRGESYILTQAGLDVANEIEASGGAP